MPTVGGQTWALNGEEGLTCHNDDFAFDPGPGRIGCNLLEDWNILEFALVWHRSYQLLAESGESPLCSGGGHGSCEDLKEIYV